MESECSASPRAARPAELGEEIAESKRYFLGTRAVGRLQRAKSDSDPRAEGKTPMKWAGKRRAGSLWRP